MPGDAEKPILLLGIDGRLRPTGVATYFGGTESVTCNRCGEERPLWECVRIGWTAVHWGCLSREERPVVTHRPEAALAIVGAAALVGAQEADE